MMKKVVIALGIILVPVITVLGLGTWAYSPGTLPLQPILFNHRLHLERVQGIACQDCHQFVATQTYAGLPSKHVCFGCHDPNADVDDKEADAANPRFAALMAFAKTENDIGWHRVTSLPPDVFFSHRRHVAVAKLDCRQCHPEMPDLTSPPTRGPIRMRMSTCIRCHEEKGASVDCVSCHR